jgi:hypothetical protein
VKIILKGKFKQNDRKKFLQAVGNLLANTQWALKTLGKKPKEYWRPYR